MGGINLPSISGRDEEVIESVRRHRLPASLDPSLDGYDRVIGARDRFLWRWAHLLFPTFTLSCVRSGKTSELQDDKLVGLMFVTVLDDIAEIEADRATFEEAAKIPFDHQSPNYDRPGIDPEVLTFASDVWQRFSSTLAEGARATEFGEIFRFDLKQVLNAMAYTYLANHHVEFVTGTELRTYDAHNMMVYMLADIDLVHSPAFDRTELSTLRQILDRAQRVVRLSNWVTTWERELHEGNFASGIVTYALENGIISADDLRSLSQDPAEMEVDAVVTPIRNHDVEAIFLRELEREIAAAREFQGAIESIDVEAYLDGIEMVTEYHLACRGEK